MKDKRQGYRDMRYLVILAFGLLIGRVWFYDINPFGVAFFAATAEEKKEHKLLALFILVGMFSSSDGIGLLKYMILYMVLITMGRALPRWSGRKWTYLYTAVVIALLNLAIGAVMSVVSVNTWEMFWLGVLESIAVFALSGIYRLGVHFFLYEEWTKVLGNEEIISVLALLLTVMYGIPRQADLIFSISATMAYLLVVFMGYRYGAPIGAITGVAGGALIAFTGEDMVAVGILCLMGVCAGAFRRAGKVIDACAYALMGGILMVMSYRELYGIIELRGMISAVIIFVALPKKVVHLIEEDAYTVEEDLYAREDIRAITHHRVAGLSDAFRRLSRSFEYEGSEETCEAVSIEDDSGCIDCRYYWHNRKSENRRVMAEQMREIATALSSFTEDLDEVEEMPQELKRDIAEELKKEGIKVRKLSIKRKHGHLEIAFTGSCQKNNCLTKTDVAKALYRAVDTPMRPTRETRNVLQTTPSTMYFQEDTRYKALTGLARIAKSGETISGDNYSFLELSATGEILMILADGMGSGQAAARDSGDLLETLEYLMEAGFEKKSALRLLNTLFVINYEGDTFTTLDMAAIDLHTGRCEIMKNGTATTYVKRSDRVDMIASGALPMGVDVDADTDVSVVWLEEGDMVIMVSDGVLDGYYERNVTDTRQTDMADLIGELACQNPHDIADQILMNALARTTREATDDMSVLVTGLWAKNI